MSQDISVELFADVKKIDVTGTSKVRGFAGTVKRWNFRTRILLTVTPCLTVFRFYRSEPDSGKSVQGKKMAGQLGNERVTVQIWT